VTEVALAAIFMVGGVASFLGLLWERIFVAHFFPKEKRARNCKKSAWNERRRPGEILDERVISRGHRLQLRRGVTLRCQARRKRNGACSTRSITSATRDEAGAAKPGEPAQAARPRRELPRRISCRSFAR